MDRLRAAGVSHVLSLDPVSAPDLGIEAVVRPARIASLAIHVYAVSRPLPRLALAALVATAPDRETAAARAAQPGFQDAGGVVVEGAVPSTGSRGAVTVVREAPDELQLDVLSDLSGLLVVRDAFAPGWRAAVAGAEAPILRADGRHRAVAVPAGQSRVVMTYRPPAFTLAWALSAASLFACVATLRRGLPD